MWSNPRKDLVYSLIIIGNKKKKKKSVVVCMAKASQWIKTVWLARGICCCAVITCPQNAVS